MNNLSPCPEWEELLALKTEDLSPRDRFALDEHLRGCEGCSATRADYQLLISQLRSSFSSAKQTVPYFFSTDLFDDELAEKREGEDGWKLAHISGPAERRVPSIARTLENALTYLLVASIIFASIVICTPLRSTFTGRTDDPNLGQLTPAQYINDIIQNMTLDQKLGQMMIVQFIGSTYTPDISAMINQYNVGAVLLYSTNNNIISRPQLTGLIAQMQHDSRQNGIPLAVAIDQEGGYVDRLVALDGPRPSASSIGANNDPSKAQAEGIRDASDLASYGFNLNLAPVVDVNTVYNPQLYGRIFGNNPGIVTRMASAYLQGLQQSGKVFGTLKHFPGLGDVATDPHVGVADVYRSKSQLEAIDWAPYRALIQQGNVHAIMVTHDILHAIDPSAPSTLSNKVVTGILRDELGFQGVVMTDSLTMQGLTAFYTESQAAALAVEAGCDLLMGASTPQDVAAMIQGIKQAYNSGAISMQRIDDSVRRILTLKYELGLLNITRN
jgi:beta-N-acetylhexosaminidase